MTGLLEGFVGRTVEVVTSDGRVVVGVLRGHDQATNVILAACHERVYRGTATATAGRGVEKVALGLHVIRGDNV
jgi:U6 snRNA-associated Sm-like protein LSm8